MKLILNLKKKIDDSYEILINQNINIAADIKKRQIGNRYLIITDNNVRRLYGNDFLNQLKSLNLKADIIHFDQGEKNKNIKTLDKLLNRALKLGLDRKSAIIALGGGVVGDTAGLVAGLYMRGIPFIQIPTTLLACVDSSIGGKTAIDLKLSKNSCGLFNQPKIVYIDTKFLHTLSPDDMKIGIVEMIKHGIIKSKEHFDHIENNLSKLLTRDKNKLIKAIFDSCTIKKEVVEKDEKEDSIRMLLNCGHTIGHAIEASMNFSISHGEGVAIGLLYESFIAHKIGILKKEDFDNIRNIIKKLGIIKKIKFNLSRIMKYIYHDKKKIGNKINFALPVKIGKAIIYDKLTHHDIIKWGKLFVY